MTTDDFKKILDNSLTPIKKQLGDIEERLDDPKNGLVAINRRLDANTGSLVTIERDIKAYGDMYKINNSNARKLEKRVEDLEENTGIIPPHGSFLQK